MSHPHFDPMNNWLSEDRLREMLSDPTLRSRLVGHAVGVLDGSIPSTSPFVLAWPSVPRAEHAERVSQALNDAGMDPKTAPWQDVQKAVEATVDNDLRWRLDAVLGRLGAEISKTSGAPFLALDLDVLMGESGPRLARDAPGVFPDGAFGLRLESWSAPASMTFGRAAPSLPEEFGLVVVIKQDWLAEMGMREAAMDLKEARERRAVAARASTAGRFGNPE